MYNWKERSWVLPAMQTNILLSIPKNPGKPAGTTDGAPHGLAKIRNVANLRCCLLLGLLLAMIQIELKFYCFGSALNSHHCCHSFPIQLTSTSLKHLFCLCFYLLIVFHIPSIYKLFSPFTLCLHSSAEMSRDMYENGTFSLPGSLYISIGLSPNFSCQQYFCFLLSRLSQH